MNHKIPLLSVKLKYLLARDELGQLLYLVGKYVKCLMQIPHAGKLRSYYCCVDYGVQSESVFELVHFRLVVEVIHERNRHICFHVLLLDNLD